ncbi:MAG: hypothetical protein ACOVOG_06540 [Rubrivivax sp.]|jgi:hypothetical protein|nr:hypothetical protein [Rubrivivax sp.]
MSSPPSDTPRDLSELRLVNALTLFDEFVSQNVRTADGAALRGLEKRFAEQLLIQPSYWSQIKSRTRHIGDRLARQFEARCRKPAGWMDVAHPESSGQHLALQLPAEPLPNDLSSTPRDDDERFIIGLVLSYYRRHPQRARTRLLDLLSEVLSPSLGGKAGDAAALPSNSVSPHLWNTARQGVNPPSAEATDDADNLWRRTQQSVAPLKKKR